MKFRFYLSLLTAKTIKTILNITKLSAGTSIIGRIVLKICPDFLYSTNQYIERKVYVTGTNGKTTTSGLITHFLKNASKSVINNSMGANMLSGVVNALAVSLNPLKKYNFSVIESDEAYLSKIYDNLDADFLVVTNLFRDQLDRYGELATTKKLIQDGIDKKSDLVLFLNADDPLVSSFKGGKQNVYYGIENVHYYDGLEPSKSSTEEAFKCPCGCDLNYTKKFFAQQGHYTCSCGYSRPEPKYKANVSLYKDYSIIEIDNKLYKVPLVGLFNAYNALAAISVCLELGINNIENSLSSFKVAFGRSEVKYLNNKKTLIQLIKNPIGANEVLKTVDLDSDILIIINDNYADGRDVSWLWDADFSLLKNSKKSIIVSGLRAQDMALRLKYAGISSSKIKVIPDITSAVHFIGKYAENRITILPTYTALLRLNKMKKLKKS